MEQNIDPRDARIAELEADRAEAYRRLAYEKLREDQITLQHRMQCNIRAELEAQLSAIGAGGVEPLRKRDCMQQSVDAVYAALPQSALARTSPENVRDVLSALRAAPAADAREVLARPTREEIAELRTQYGVTSDGRGIKEFEQVFSFAKAVLGRWGVATAPSQEHATQLAGGARGAPQGWQMVPVERTEEMKRAAMELLLDGLDIYVNGQDQIVIETDAPRRLWKAMLAASPDAPVREPLTADALADKCEAWLQASGASNIVDAYEAGYRECESAHGIQEGGSNAD